MSCRRIPDGLLGFALGLLIAVLFVLALEAVRTAPSPEITARQRQATYCRDQGWHYQPATNTCIIRRRSP